MTIVIAGAGFGGLYTAKYLLKKCKNEKIILINKHNYFLFAPLLHEVATGSQNRHNIMLEIRGILKAKNFEFHAAEIKKIDFNKKEVITETLKIKYDKLIIAIGSKPNFIISGSSKYALPLKSIKDAAKIRNKTISSLENASSASSRNEKNKFLTFVIIGGGPTGVELSAELSEFINENLKVYNKIKKEDIRIYLIQREAALMPQLVHQRCRELALQRLKKKGVTVLLNTQVNEVKQNAIIFNNAQIPTYNIFLTAGVTPNTINTEPEAVNKNGFYEVDEYFQVKNLKGIYAIGDCALNFNPNSTKPNPQLAQLAVKQAKHLANNISLEKENKKKVPFIFKPDGFLVSVGEWWAIAEIHNHLLKGKFAWWLWRTIYLSKIIGIKNKIRVGLEWFLLLFSKRDASEI